MAAHSDGRPCAGRRQKWQDVCQYVVGLAVEPHVDPASEILVVYHPRHEGRPYVDRQVRPPTKDFVFDFPRGGNFIVQVVTLPPRQIETGQVFDDALVTVLVLVAEQRLQEFPEDQPPLVPTIDVPSTNIFQFVLDALGSVLPHEAASLYDDEQLLGRAWTRRGRRGGRTFELVVFEELFQFDLAPVSNVQAGAGSEKQHSRSSEFDRRSDSTCRL